MRLANWNAAIWAIGNGLVGTTLVIYLARQLGADGVAIGWIVAAPHLAGALRLLAPVLARRWGGRKRFCVAMYAASGAVLAALPVVCAPGVLANADESLVALVALWCAYHLLEYLATVALWSWLGDLVPSPIRGRFIGRRERALTLARIVGLLAGGQIADRWVAAHQADAASDWIGYALAAALGVVFLLAAVVPLVKMPHPRRRGDAAQRPNAIGVWSALAAMLAPLVDRRYRPLVAFGCWFSFCNGLAQAPQYLFQTRVLDLTLTAVVVMQTAMRLGQSAISPMLGRVADRGRSTAMMMTSQAIVASSTLFFYAATPETWAWFAGAHLAWIAYAGLNVGLPRLMLNLAPGGSANHVAAYFATTGVVFAAGSLVGGHWFEKLAEAPEWLSAIPGVEDRYDLFFLGSAALRMLSVVWLARIVETCGRAAVRGNQSSG